MMNVRGWRLCLSAGAIVLAFGGGRAVWAHDSIDGHGHAPSDVTPTRGGGQLRVVNRVPLDYASPPVASTGWLELFAGQVAAGGGGKADGRPAMADAFEPFKDRVKVRWDDRWLYVESDGMPAHRLMVGITRWIGRFPIPQDYTGSNAWQIPRTPVAAKSPMSAKTGFYRGAIAVAANGVPIFNPLTNNGRDTFLAGELDEFGGHAGNGEDYHYHLAPLHLTEKLARGMPLGYALDGYPLYGLSEPDGTPVGKLDALNGHADAKGDYHYHATKAYPYVNGGFHGEVTARGGQVDPQPRAQSPRPRPLGGATDAHITAFETVEAGTRYVMKYELRGGTQTVRYGTSGGGVWTFEYVAADGTTTQETGRIGGGRREGGDGAGGRPGDGPRRGGPGGEGEPPRRPEDGQRPPEPPERGDRPPTPPGRGEARGGGNGGGGGGPQQEGQRKPWMQMHGAELDADHDGFITWAEMTADADRAFAAYDRDKDGAVTAAERMAAGDVRAGSALAGLTYRHFEQLDADHDGRVTRAELTAAVKYIFGTGDADKDGKVCEAEWKGAPNAPLPPRER